MTIETPLGSVGSIRVDMFSTLVSLFSSVVIFEVEIGFTAPVGAPSSSAATHTVSKSGGESLCSADSFLAPGESAVGATAGMLVSYSTTPFESGVMVVDL